MKLFASLSCLLFCSLWLAAPYNSAAQTLGGQAAYNFLKLPSSPLLTAAGGVNVSYGRGEVSLTANNPALLRTDVNKQVNLSFNSFFAGAKTYALTGGFFAEKPQIMFGGHVHYLDYGTLPATDAAGNINGTFRPVDFVVQASAAKQYLERWTYGLTLKYISSSYAQYRSSALAADVAVHYNDSANGFSAAMLVKNMGAQIKSYGTEKEELPFDLQAGVTKRLKGAPFAFSVTAQHLQQFDILYDDTTFNRDNNFRQSTSTLSKLMTHFVLASHLYLGPHIEATLGYNLLRQRELQVANGGNGLTGFSGGLRLRFTKLQVLYARSAYQRGVASNQIGVTIHLDRLFGLSAL